ncbi:hypothetical protein R4466_04800 [Acinetobacter baumannii]|nr:hypothetical protein [Acinetobacter baumannii]
MKKIIFIFLIISLVGCTKSESNLSSEKSAKNAVNSTNEKVQNSVVEKNNWQLKVSKDEMREVETKWLSTISLNNADLSFPYDGDNHMHLDILDSKSGQPRIFLTIDKGQYDCGRSVCNSYIKFGNSPVQMADFSVHDVAGGDGKILIFNGNSDAFLKNIRRINNIIIEVPFYRDGSRQFKFDTSGFNEAEKRI